MMLDCAGKSLDLSQPQVMGVLNVTPDSFSDGGRFNRLNDALQQALTMGSHVVERPPQVMLLSSNSSPRHLEIRAGIFFNTVIAGCNCADDPTPVAGHPEYCEVQFDIDRQTALATVTLLQDST